MVIGNADNQRGICGKAQQADAQERAGSALEDWEVRKNGKAYAGGPISTRPDDQTARQMSKSGYILYIDGKRVKICKGGAPGIIAMTGGHICRLLYAGIRPDRLLSTTWGEYSAEKFRPYQRQSGELRPWRTGTTESNW